MRAISSETTLEVRYPHATRPWQHVLEALSGYLCLGQKLITGNKNFGQAWNFGPGVEGNRTVVEVLSVLSRLKDLWPALNWKIVDNKKNHHESNLLHLDSAKARQWLEWQPVWSFDEGLQATANWYRANIENKLVISEQQLKDYITSAEQLDLPWRSQ